MRVAPLLTALVLLPTAALLTGCDPAVPRVDGSAGPVTAAPTTTAPAVPAPSTPASRTPASRTPAPPPASKPSVPPPAPPPATLGPDGLGKLTLGMTERQASATGLIGAWSDGGLCRMSRLRGASADGGGLVYAMADFGVVIVDAYGNLRTPEGIRLGSSWAGARRAYPKLRAAQGGGLGDPAGIAFTEVPGNRGAYYRLAWRDGKVTDLTLQDRDAGCYE
ncbi:hypothetical protein [Krasilnikovia cinnamomea]|nr:hypothetical protein [Krasilnikovia cinnamomea]